jgi:rfaE bifunctional protein kinase chain/domain
MQIVVIGDAILDEYLIGTATRLSREAPIPVLEFEERRLIAGGAANPAANIISLGGKAALLAISGNDAEGDLLRRVLNGAQVDTDGLVNDAERPTTIKTRVMAHIGLRFPQQVARIDKLSRQPISSAVADELIERGNSIFVGKDAALFSDYHAGLLTPSLVSALAQSARNAGLFLTADAQGVLEKYKHFDVVKCNAEDARNFLRRDLQTDSDFEDAARELRALLELHIGMVITRGGDGATFETRDGDSAHVPAPAISDVFDTVGAGDTHIAVLTLAVAAGASLGDAVTLANAASGIVVRHVGNYTPTPDELTSVLG